MVADVNPAHCDQSTAQGVTGTPSALYTKLSLRYSSLGPDLPVQMINTRE